MPDRDRTHAHRRPPEKETQGKTQGTVRFEDFGDEVHLWIEQQVPWKVALAILRELKAPAAPDDETERE